MLSINIYWITSFQLGYGGSMGRSAHCVCVCVCVWGGGMLGPPYDNWGPHIFLCVCWGGGSYYHALAATLWIRCCHPRFEEIGVDFGWVPRCVTMYCIVATPEPRYCPACRTTLVATRFRVAVICPIIQGPHCIRVLFYFVWFVFINHIFQFYYELCTYCNILDIYLSSNLNFVNYVLFYMKLLNYLFFSMFGSVLESCELTGVCLLLPWLIKWK